MTPRGKIPSKLFIRLIGIFMQCHCQVVKDLPTRDKFQVATPPVILIHFAYDEVRNKRPPTVDTKETQFHAFIIRRKARSPVDRASEVKNGDLGSFHTNKM